MAFPQTHCQTLQDEILIYKTWNDVINKIDFDWSNFDICFKRIKCLISSESQTKELNDKTEDILMDLINKIEIEQEKILRKKLEFHREELQRFHITIGVYNSKY